MNQQNTKLKRQRGLSMLTISTNQPQHMHHYLHLKPNLNNFALFQHIKCVNLLAKT